MKEKVKKIDVSEQSSPTVTVNQEAEDLADEVIGGVSKISTILGKVASLKNMFNDGERDGNHRLKVPIKSCYTWEEFCNRWLDRDIRTIQKQLAALNPKPPTAPKPARTTLTAKEQAIFDLGVTKTLAGQAFVNGTDVQLAADYSVPKVTNRLATITKNTLNAVESLQDRDSIARAMMAELQSYLLPTTPTVPNPDPKPSCTDLNDVPYDPEPPKSKKQTKPPMSPAGQVHINELPPESRARVMFQIGSAAVQQ